MISVDCSYDPNSWKALDATDLVSVEEGYDFRKDPGGVCCDCEADRSWPAVGLPDGIYTLICHKCKTDHTAIVREKAPWVRNQIRVGDDRWYYEEKPR